MQISDGYSFSKAEALGKAEWSDYNYIEQQGCVWMEVHGQCLQW